MAHLLVLMFLNFKYARVVLGGPFGMGQLILLVAFGRVFFHCHFIGDTMFGSLVGMTVAMATTKLGLKGLLKTVIVESGALGFFVSRQESIGDDY